MERLAILCPGQGNQYPQMFDLARTDARVQSRLQHWPLEAICGMSLQTVLGRHDLLFANRLAQPLIVAAELAIWEAIRPRVPAPALVAGYSIGEVASYGVAGALPAEQVIELAAARAHYMDACIGPSIPQSLVAVSGLRGTAMEDLLASRGLSIAIENGEDSLILGGRLPALQEIEPLLTQMGGHVTPIAVEIAAHTPLMLGAVEPFRERLSHCSFAHFDSPVLAGISAESVSNKEQALTLLPRQIAEKICWAQCMDACAEAGITVALELGPGAALSRMLRARHPTIECRSVADFRTLTGIFKWLERHLK